MAWQWLPVTRRRELKAYQKAEEWLMPADYYGRLMTYSACRQYRNDGEASGADDDWPGVVNLAYYGKYDRGLTNDQAETIWRACQQWRNDPDGEAVEVTPVMPEKRPKRYYWPPERLMNEAMKMTDAGKKKRWQNLATNGENNGKRSGESSQQTSWQPASRQQRPDLAISLPDSSSQPDSNKLAENNDVIPSGYENVTEEPIWANDGDTRSQYNWNYQRG